MDFVWQWYRGRRISNLRQLMYGEIEVCRIRWELGAWRAYLHVLGSATGASRIQRCSSLEAGEAGCLQWAERHRASIEAYAAEQREAVRRIRGEKSDIPQGDPDAS